MAREIYTAIFSVINIHNISRGKSFRDFSGWNVGANVCVTNDKVLTVIRKKEIYLYVETQQYILHFQGDVSLFGN
jgi:hypothetical protein